VNLLFPVHEQEDLAFCDMYVAGYAKNAMFVRERHRGPFNPGGLRMAGMIAAGMIRAGPVVAAPDLLRGFGVDPDPLIAAAGLTPDMLDDTETPVPFVAVGRLLALAAERTDCAHFGLRLGQRTGIAALGVIGLVMQNSSDVRTALQTFASHYSRHDGGGALVLRMEPAAAAIGYRIPDPAIPGVDQLMDCALAVGVQLMRSLCGPEWHPVEAMLAHARPADPGPFQSLFQAPLRFDAEITALAFDPAWLDHRLSHAQPGLRDLLLQFMTTPEREHGPISDESSVLCDEVRRVLRTRIAQGDASLAGVADALGLHPRTLHRRLAESGATFKSLVNEIRHEAARQLLEQTTMPLGRIATLLGYADASSFTRSFRSRAGMPPASWRGRRRPR
jgi:AraC-like DNA-binding protein